jgi:hypothetical protein
MNGRASVAGVLALVGGVAAVVGSFLPWAEVSAGTFTEQFKGVDGWEGKAAVVSGLVMVVAGARVVAGSHRAITRMRPGAAIGGLVAFGVGLYTALTTREQLLDAARGLPRAEVERALDNGVLELSIAIGLIIVIAGGAQGIVAALLSIGVSEPAPPPTSGPGLRGWSIDRPSRATGPPPSPGQAVLPPPPSETGPSS